MSIIKTLGSSNNTDAIRAEEDYYATDPSVVRALLELEEFDGILWECACGDGRLAREMEKSHDVAASDIVDRGYGDICDFFCKLGTGCHIITNPPYKLVNKWILHGMEVLQPGYKMALLLQTRYLEGKARRKIFDIYPPKTIYVSSSRIKIYKNGEYIVGNAVSYSWFVWQKGYQGSTELKWFN